MARKLKLINEKANKGIFIEEGQLIKIAKVCKTRNHSMYNKLKEDYEYLFEEKFPEY